MVAIFWDDLTTINGIITHYDQFNDSFIIEWSEVETYYANSVESFQIILYNTDFPLLPKSTKNRSWSMKSINLIDTAFVFLSIGIY